MATVVATRNPTIHGAVALGTTTDVIDWSSVKTGSAFQVMTTFGAATTVTAQLRGSMDGAVFYNIGAAITVVGVTLVTTLPFRYTAVSVTAFGGASPGVTVAVGVL